MPNRFHLRARIDRLWRRSAEHNPGYIRIKALDAIVRELYAPNPQARLNHHLYLTTDPYDVARHKLRALYDTGAPVLAPEISFCPPLPLGEACPALDAGGWGEGYSALQEEESLEEDDDPW